MKSNVKNKIINRTGNKSGNKIILSIGMIVKNEEKHLDKCLTALQKLRDKVSNELIIVDTGSTDRTKEIALKYTDKVYDFEWINDFSAARNHGLEKATGEWFMFIDADEYLDEDCQEMIDFFNMPEVNQQYNSASYFIRNYANGSKKASNQFLAPRLVRNYEGLKFSDPIHEWLPQPLPHGYFGTVFHHYGYVFDSKDKKDEKSKRNMEPLLKEYEKTPKDLRVLYHICDSIYDNNYFKTRAEKEKYLNEFMTEAKENLDEPYSLGAYIKYAAYYFVFGDYEKAADVLEEFVQLKQVKKSILIVEAYYYIALTYLNMEKYDECFKAIEKYFESYERYNRRELDMTDMRFGTIQGITEDNYSEMQMHGARCLNNLKRYSEALEYLNKQKLSEMDFPQLKLYINVLRDLIDKTCEYKYAVYCYEKILGLNDNDKTGLMLYFMEQYYMEHVDEREAFIREVCNTGTKGKYVELAGIIKDDMDGRDVSIELSGFIDSIDRWNDGYGEAIYLAMKHDVDVLPAIEKMSHNVLKDIMTRISDAHFDTYSKIALEYCLGFDYAGGIRQMFWCVTALEAAVYKSDELKNEYKPDLYDFFISLLSDYVSNIYNPELLSPGDVEVLPELHRFGYYITLAFNAKNDGDLIGYVRNMKEALTLCEPMKDVVSFYLNELEEEMKR